MEGKTEVCVDCGKLSPTTETDYTLISQRHGWRLTREKRPDGTYEVSWHCPSCWRALKAAAKQRPEG